MKQFLYLYPIPEYFDLEISWGADRMNFKSKRERETKFKDKYSYLLNKCVDERYRKNDFKINWAVFNYHEISDIVEVKKEDRIIQVGMDFDTHCRELPDKSYRYPENDYILDKLSSEQGAAGGAVGQGASSVVPEKLVISGFHALDCVEKLASRACERGIDTLIDEDLTQFFKFRIFDKDFRIDLYQPGDISNMDEDIRQEFVNARKGKPYFLQDYW